MLVTGASRGIGSAIADALAETGAIVVCVARTGGDPSNPTPCTLAWTVRGIASRGGTAISVEADLGVPGEAAGLMAGLLDRFGRVDVVVNNAATIRQDPIMRYTPDAWAAGWTLNVVAPTVLAQLALPGMLERGRGSIIAIGSRGATTWAADQIKRIKPSLAVYAIQKNALESSFHRLAADLDGTLIQIAAIAPRRPIVTPGAVAAGRVMGYTGHHARRVAFANRVAELCTRGILAGETSGQSQLVRFGSRALPAVGAD